ncbi:MAG: hypothetical protein AAFQ37_08650, partial [Bacteroidota bacterium]
MNLSTVLGYFSWLLRTVFALFLSIYCLGAQSFNTEVTVYNQNQRFSNSASLEVELLYSIDDLGAFYLQHDNNGRKSIFFTNGSEEQLVYLPPSGPTHPDGG